jgi:hypothetical protein
MKFHYTYRLAAINPIDSRVEYIGVRSSSVEPADDAAYMSSSRTISKLISDGVVFKKEIIAVWPTRAVAVAHEVELHNLHDVGRSPRFFNKAKQTTVGFDTEGTQIGDKNCMANPLVRARHAEALTSEGYRDRVSEGVLRAMSNPEVAARVNKAKADAVRRPEVRAKLGAASKVAMARPEVKARHSAATKAALLSPEVNAKLRAGHARRWSDDNQRVMQSKRLKAAYKNDPSLVSRIAHHGSSNGMYGASHSQSAKEKMSEARKMVALKKTEFCKAHGIANAGKGHCNIDKAAFEQWIAQNA